MLTGPSASYDRAGLLAFGLQFAAKIANIDKETARKLDAANRKTPGKLSYRSLQTTASELERQLAWMQNQRSEAFPALHCPNGVRAACGWGGRGAHPHENHPQPQPPRSVFWRYGGRPQRR